MNKKRFSEAMNQVDTKYIDEVISYTPKIRKNYAAIRAVAAVLVLVIGICTILSSGPSGILDVYAISMAEYPEMAPVPDESKYSGEALGKVYTEWRADKAAQVKNYYEMNIDFDDFFEKTLRGFLSESNGESVIYSPLNVYMALAMLAETTSGNSRQQILNLIGVDSIQTLRTQANAIWNANYCNDGAVTSILANSIWLDEDIDFNKSTLDILAENYYTSSFQGEMGSADFNKALKTWLSENTGGFLDELIEKDAVMTPETVMAIASTVFFNAKWMDKFSKEENDIKTFHSENGDVQHEFMNQEQGNYYYRGDNFGAVGKEFTEGGNMWFILPDEGVDISEVTSGTQLSQFISADGIWENKQLLTVNFSVPKFDVSSNLSLSDKLADLGVTDIFDNKIADFSPLSEKEKNTSVSAILHDVRVTIDEEGCTAASFMIIYRNGTTYPENKIDFILDRPFIFAVTSEVGLPLYIGVVNQIG